MQSDQLIIIPEYVLLKTVQNILTFIRTDYENATDKDKSYLRRILKYNALERYDTVKQAEAVFIQESDNPRFLEADLMFNVHRDGAPSIHITLPAENTQNGGNGMGTDERYRDSIIETDDEENVIGVRTVFTRRFTATYNVVITSDNSNEVTLIYHVMRSLLISSIPSMHLAGLENVRLGGQDVTINSQQKVFIKAISIYLEYEASAPNLFTDPVFHNIFFTGTPIL